MVMGGTAIDIKSAVLPVHYFSFTVSLEDGASLEVMALD
jgi:hypothetical protein